MGQEISVSQYVITIAPDNGARSGDPTAQTTIRVDTSSGHALITELTVRAADGGGLAPGDLPALDLDLLIRALAGPVGTGPLAKAAGPDDTAPAGGRRAGRNRSDSRRRPANKSTSADLRTPARRAAAGTKTVPRTAPKAQVGKAMRGAAAPKATPAKAGRAVKAVESADDRERRAYRRMPDPTEVMAAYRQAGTIGGVAEHFGVPRHTATSWARRLRQQGHAIGRG